VAGALLTALLIPLAGFGTASRREEREGKEGTKRKGREGGVGRLLISCAPSFEPWLYATVRPC